MNGMTDRAGMCLVAVTRWNRRDEVAEAIEESLFELGYRTLSFLPDQGIPPIAEIVFSFGPYGKFTRLIHDMENWQGSRRPRWIHWNTELTPNLRIPWPLMGGLAAARAWAGRQEYAGNAWGRRLFTLAWVQALNRKMTRFRLLGDYHYAYHKGLLDLLVESSQIYAGLRRRHGVPAVYAPWGSSPEWYENLGLERDIDLLWMGKRRTARRSRILEDLRRALEARGGKVYLADGEEHPFIYGHERTRLLNRARITINLLSRWFDNAFPYRFHMAAGNRSLVITEPKLAHIDNYHEGEHYVSAQVDKLAETVVHYLQHEDERCQIVENAYRLVTEEMTFTSSVRRIMEEANQAVTKTLITALRLNLQAADQHLAPVRAGAVLEQIDALPGSQAQFAVIDRDG